MDHDKKKKDIDTDREKLRQEALLSEYNLAHREVLRLNRQLWMTGQILIPLSLAGLTVFAMTKEHSIEMLFQVLGAGVLSSSILYGWYSLSQKWMSYQSLAQYRMTEIETELNLWCTKYELFGAVRRHRDRSYPKFNDNDFEIMQDIPEEIFPKGSSVKTSIKNLVLLIVFAWILLATREVFYFLSDIGYICLPTG